MARLFKPAVPNVSVLSWEFSKVGDESAYFAMINLPQGSTMFDAKNKKRYDTKRGMIVFTMGSFIYLVSSGENPSVFQLGDSEKPLAKLKEIEKRSLCHLFRLSRLKINEVVFRKERTK